MNEIVQKLIKICENYINNQYSVEEFQKRLETVYLPDEYKHTLEIDQHNALNHLEKFGIFIRNLNKKICR